MKYEIGEVKTIELPRWQDIPERENDKRALEVALSGNHTICIVSSVGADVETLLRATARVAQENGFPFHAEVIPCCPCGKFLNTRMECNCSETKRATHIRRLIKQYYDIYFQASIPRARNTYRGEEEQRITQRIRHARLQRKMPITFTDTAAKELLKLAQEKVFFGIEQQNRTIEVAKTIAAMDEKTAVLPHHIAEAIQYQSACFPFVVQSSFDVI